jgi:glyoxylase-like metal-dependent hydrolase (beta-lactamase superfamily II)
VIVETFPVGLLQCNCTIVGDPRTGEAIVVDPGDETAKVQEALQRLGLKCTAIVNTHTHIDHVGGNHGLREATGARVMLHESDLPLYDNLPLQAQWLGIGPAPMRAPVDEHIHHGDRVSAGDVTLDVLHTPGHTPGSVCFYLPGGAPLLMSGDTLFAGSIGRSDLWGGNHEQELGSIRDHLLTLGDATRVIPGHGPETTIGLERARNPFLVGL